MNTQGTFYLCPTCFEVTESHAETHQHTMIEVKATAISDQRRQPVTDESGRVLSRAPQWFLEAIGTLRPRYPRMERQAA
ncbi:MAG: hypothetical protein M3220_15455 [Chloroflexota bacterium]|nr:hypothetical protein [Chloroflexota bacterium]